MPRRAINESLDDDLARVERLIRFTTGSGTLGALMRVRRERGEI